MLLAVLVIAICAMSLLVNAYPEKPQLFRYNLARRIPTLIVMMIAAFSIGSASIIM
jgi:ABC-type enterochelin transport system permease subunit